MLTFHEINAKREACLKELDRLATLRSQAKYDLKKAEHMEKTTKSLVIKNSKASVTQAEKTHACDPNMIDAFETTQDALLQYSTLDAQFFVQTLYNEYYKDRLTQLQSEMKNLR